MSGLPSGLRRSGRALMLGSAVLATLAAPAITSSATALPAVAAVVAPLRAAKAKPFRVASFNVRNANTNSHRKNEKSWAKRRGVIVDQIRGQGLDVLGVQEASQGQLHGAAAGGRKISQFEDLVGRLGGGWRVTNDARYNCVRAWTPTRCDETYTGASGGVRILYDSDRVELVDQGSRALPVPKGNGDMFMAWAELEQRSTGKRFLVANLHTVSQDRYFSYKVKQAKAALATLRANNPDDLPMIALGDWNSSRFEKPSNGPYDVFRKAGFVDPLGGAYGSRGPRRAVVEHTVRAWLNSSNSSWKRKAPNHKSWKLGSYIDYIMTTRMRVSEWETVARLKKGRYVGTIPSDHNMIRATVYLP